MSLDMYRSRNSGYMPITRLVEMFQYGIDNDFEFDDVDSQDYIEKDSDGSDALRIVFMCMCYEDVISSSERWNIASAVSWHDPDDPRMRHEVISPFFKLGIIKYKGITDIKGLVDFLNNYPVNEMIKENAIGLFRALDDGFISNHYIIYYSDESKELWPDTHDRYKYLYRLDLSKIPELSGYRGKECLSREYLRHHMAGKELVELLDSGIAFPQRHSIEGNWAYYEKVKSERTTYFAGCNVITGKKVKYEGCVVSHNETTTILQKDNILYRIDGNEIKKIYTLNEFEYVDTHRSFFYSYENKLLIAPVLRGKFIPFLIDYNGEYVRQDTTVDMYIWYSIISLEKLLVDGKDVSYHDFCYPDPFIGNSEDEDLKIEKCSINGILQFMERIAVTRPKLVKSMHYLAKYLLLVGHVIDNDMDISDLLMSARNDFIDSESKYWTDVIRIKYGSGEDEEIINRDLLSKRFYDDLVLGYKHCHFLSDEYVSKVFKMYADGKLSDYIGQIWFGEMCKDAEFVDPWHKSLYDDVIRHNIDKSDDE